MKTSTPIVFRFFRSNGTNQAIIRLRWPGVNITRWLAARRAQRRKKKQKRRTLFQFKCKFVFATFPDPRCRGIILFRFFYISLSLSLSPRDRRGPYISCVRFLVWSLNYVSTCSRSPLSVDADREGNRNVFNRNGKFPTGSFLSRCTSID